MTDPMLWIVSLLVVGCCGFAFAVARMIDRLIEGLKDED